MSGFSSKQVVAMVVAVCAAVVVAPVGVMAATGQLVNIADPGNAGRVARVGAAGTLQVEVRPGVVQNSFSTMHERVTDVLGHTLYEATAPARVALTEATFALRGENSASVNHVRIYSRVRTSGTASCENGTGWTTPKTLRTVVLRGGNTVQLVFPGPPLISQMPAAGQRVCLAFQQTKWAGTTELDVAVTGYTFS